MPATTGSPPRNAAGCHCAGMTVERRFDLIGTCSRYTIYNVNMDAVRANGRATTTEIRTPNEVGAAGLRPLWESFGDLLEIPQIRRPLIFFGGHQETVGAQ